MILKLKCLNLVLPKLQSQTVPSAVGLVCSPQGPLAVTAPHEVTPESESSVCVCDFPKPLMLWGRDAEGLRAMAGLQHRSLNNSGPPTRGAPS